MGELEIFALRIKELRERLQMSQKDFSNLLGIKQQTLSGYERGAMKPPLDVAKNIAEKCNVSLDWLCGIQTTIEEPKLETYSELFSLIVKIVDAYNGLWYLNTNSDPYDNSTSSASIDSYNPEIIHFVCEWKQLRTLYINGTIDEYLYTLWLKDKLKQYENTPIDPNAQKEVHTKNSDEELPFD